MESHTSFELADGPNDTSEIRVWMTLREASFTLKKSLSVIDAEIRAGKLKSRLSAHGTIEVLASMPLMEVESRPLIAQSSQQSAVDALAASLMAMSPNKPTAREVIMTRATPILKSAQERAAKGLSAAGLGIKRLFSFLGRLGSGLMTKATQFRWSSVTKMRESTGRWYSAARTTAANIPPHMTPATWAPWVVIAAVLLLVAGITVGTRLGTRPAATPDLSENLKAANDYAQKLVAERDQLRTQLSEVNDTLAKAQNDLTVERNIEDTLFKAIQAAKASASSNNNNPAFADSVH